jgi:phosphohistidine phosphatase
VKVEAMARQLWLLRHADAEPHGTRSDFERRLTERGERQARLAGAALARIGVEFERVLSSPRERALRTATLTLQAWSEQAQGVRLPDGLDIHEPLGAGFDVPQALAAVADLSPHGRLLAIGHEPDLSSVVEQLTGARIDLKKGGLVVVRLSATMPPPGPNGLSAGDAALASDDPSAGAAGELVLLLRPVELALIEHVAPSVEA